jgi:hypothetical protein
MCRFAEHTRAEGAITHVFYDVADGRALTQI